MARASDADPSDEATARRFAAACMRMGDQERAPVAWQRVIASAPGDAQAWSCLGTALLETGDVAAAVAASAKAIELAPDNPALVSNHGFALRAAGDDDQADSVFERGFARDPANSYLIRGVGQALIRRGDGRALAAHCEAAAERIATTGWLIAQYATALAMLGRGQDLASLIDYDLLFEAHDISPPPGFASLEAFNGTLREEQEMQSRRPSGVAAMDVAHGAMRVRGGLEGAVAARGEAGAPASAALLRLFDTALQAHEERVSAAADTLHMRTKPSSTWLRTAAVMTPRQGYIAPHTHACTWLTAVYYAEVPDGLEGKEGCMEFAPPLHKVALPEGLWPSRLVKPHAGLLALFPGYFYHHVYPTRAAGERFVITFDVKPTRESRTVDAGRGAPLV